MSVHIIDPMGMTVREWADAMTIDLEQFGNIGRLDRDEDWRGWGLQLMTMGLLSGTTVPDPYAFPDWRPWAASLTNNLAGVA